MAFCSNCGSQIAENQKFCPNCGTAASGTAPQQAAPARSSKDGEVIKCPSCGAAVSSWDTKCPECGYEFRNRSAAKSVNEFFEHYRTADPSEKANIIKTFPVPNTKEDILTFLTMSIGNTKGLTDFEERIYINQDQRSVMSALTGGGSSKGSTALQYRQQEIAAWRAKVQQVLDMGKLLLKDDESQTLFQKYEQQLNKEVKKLSSIAKVGIGFAIFWALVIIMAIMQKLFPS